MFNYQKNQLPKEAPGCPTQSFNGSEIVLVEETTSNMRRFFCDMNSYENNLPELIIIGQDQNVRDTSEYKKID